MLNMKLIVIGLLLIATTSTVFADTTLEQIYSTLDIVPDDAFTNNARPLLKTYNKQRGHKSLAFALTNDGGFAVGMGYKAPSELAASMTARLKCEDWLRESEMTGICEILLVRDQIVMPGARMRAGIDANTPSMAWRVDGPNSTLYLIGTLHMLKQTLLPLPDVFDQFFVAADQLALEVNPLLITDPERLAKIRALVTSDPKVLKGQFDKASRKVVRSYVKSQGIKEAVAYEVNPVATALQVTKIKTAALGYSTEIGVEMHYTRQASTAGKAIIELEDAVEVMAMMFDYPVSLQIKMLTETIKHLGQSPRALEGLIEDWLRGDSTAFYAQTAEDMLLHPDLASFKTRLLDDRNEQWMVKIDELLQQDKHTAVMVGAAHMGGEQGLLALLKARGLEPVQYSWGGTPLVEKTALIELTAQDMPSLAP
jgi:uncharacterized protein YbaP (TraB family)